MSRIDTFAASAALALAVPAAHASVELIDNGGFESAGGFSGGFETMGAGLDGTPVGGGDKFFYASVTAPVSYTFDIDGKTLADMGWVRKSFSVVATSNISTLSLVGDPYHSYYGAALDDISVTAAVPEPATYGMRWPDWRWSTAWRAGENSCFLGWANRT